MSMNKIENIDPNNIRETIVPLEIESIKEYFEKKDLFFIINYGKSQVKGSMFLTYISNLDLPCEINFNDATKQEKFDIVKVYMETRNINNSDVLRITVADLLLSFKNFDVTGLFHNPIFTNEEKAEFIGQNLELFKKWDQFLFSTMIFLIKSFPELNKVLQIEGQFKEKEDPAFIGLNVVNLFSIPSFLEMYYTTPLQQELFYFKTQFDEHIFKGKNFYSYYNCEENTFLHLLTAVLVGDIDPKELVDFVVEEAK